MFEPHCLKRLKKNHGSKTIYDLLTTDSIWVSLSEEEKLAFKEKLFFLCAILYFEILLPKALNVMASDEICLSKLNEIYHESIFLQGRFPFAQLNDTHFDDTIRQGKPLIWGQISLSEDLDYIYQKRDENRFHIAPFLVSVERSVEEKHEEMNRFMNSSNTTDFYDDHVGVRCFLPSEDGDYFVLSPKTFLKFSTDSAKVLRDSASFTSDQEYLGSEE